MFRKESKYQQDLIERSKKEREESIQKYNKNLHPADKLDEDAAMAALIWLGACVAVAGLGTLIKLIVG